MALNLPGHGVALLAVHRQLRRLPVPDPGAALQLSWLHEAMSRVQAPAVVMRCWLFTGDCAPTWP